MSEMQIVYKDINDLQMYENNPRKNSDAVQYVANSIQQFGFKNPIIIDKDNVIVCGHTRYKAARRLKMAKVPCIMADDLTEDQIRAFRLADNKTAEMATWDYERLEQEFALIDPMEFDIADFGFFPVYEPDEDEEDDEEDDDVGLREESYSLIIDCESKAEQKDTFERLMKMGIIARMV
ncbi:MAG: ParB N-terminal domain-containing protein [Bacteroidales bacterium]|nr:ParB N-terminal domain-containing protein [Bacteroidales bacterium]